MAGGQRERRARRSGRGGGVASSRARLKAAVDELEKGPDIGWQLGELLVASEEEIESDNSSVYVRPKTSHSLVCGRVSSGGSLGHKSLFE